MLGRIWPGHKSDSDAGFIKSRLVLFGRLKSHGARVFIKAEHVVELVVSVNQLVLAVSALTQAVLGAVVEAPLVLELLKLLVDWRFTNYCHDVF